MSDEAGMLRVNSDGTISGSCIAGAGNSIDLNNSSSESDVTYTTGNYKLIYIYSIDDDRHENYLKIGDASIHTEKSYEEITQEELNEAARLRIDQQTKTARVKYKLEHAEIALYEKVDSEGKKSLVHFRDYDVHRVLNNSGFPKGGKIGGEWFLVTLPEAIDAIAAVKEERQFTDKEVNEIVLRPEQEAAVKQTLKVFKNGTIKSPKRMLWNAKMRFGKTLTAYSLLKKLGERDEEAPRRVLISTHRPEVHGGWLKDFKKAGLPELGWKFRSKKNGDKWSNVKNEEKLIWFASIQDLRGQDKSAEENNEYFESSFKKDNQELFEEEWDLIISDEVHEGTLTDLAKNIYDAEKAKYYLDLSGTPFNVVKAESWEDEKLKKRFSYDGQYNWSYIDERKAKEKWEKEHPDESGPYDELPEIKFVTYDVSETIPDLRVKSGSTYSIDFSKLFETRVNNGQVVFVNETDVKRLLNKMRGAEEFSNDPSLFPFHDNFKSQFHHTLWMLPNVPACLAMEDLLKKQSSGFGGWGIVNATGEGLERKRNSMKDGEVAPTSSLDWVNQTIKSYENSITLSQGMLTTGVSVTDWTAVFMFNNTTSPMLYMQTAFRGTTAGTLKSGRVKERAYVFDFNPNRCLREIVEIAKNSGDPSKKATDSIQEDTEKIKDHLTYISVLSLNGAKFVEADSDSIMKQLNEVYVNEILDKGFDSPLLWNKKELDHFDIEKSKIINILNKLNNKGKENKSLEITSLTDEEKARLLELKAQAERENDSDEDSLSDKESKELSELENQQRKKEKKNRDNAVKVLSGVAARLPMLVFASPADEKITPDNFASLIDEESWREFMPKNLIRVMPEGTPSLEKRQEEALGNEGNKLYWDDISRFFDANLFSLASEQIRQLSRSADEKPPLERTLDLINIFSKFKNPDKETVLTPYRVVDLQYTSTLGGLQLVDQKESTAKDLKVRLRKIDKALGDESDDTDMLESHSLSDAIELLSTGMYEIAPEWIDADSSEISEIWDGPKASFIDINSKTAMYPLFAALSLWYRRKDAYRREHGVDADGKARDDADIDKELWKEIVENNIYVNCRVPYSDKIARRVLIGLEDDDIKVNSTVVDIVKLKKALENSDEFKKDDIHEVLGKILRLSNEGFLRNNSDIKYSKLVSEKVNELIGKINSNDEGTENSMDAIKQLKEIVDESNEIQRYSAVVGNPPYQFSSEGMMRSDSIYHHFMNVSESIGKLVSLIYPSRWMFGGAGNGLDDFRNKEAQSKKYEIFYDFSNSESIFSPPVSIAGGVNFFLWNSKKESDGVEYFYDYIHEKRKFLGEAGLLRGSAAASIGQKVEAVLSLQNIVYHRVYYGESVRNLDKIKKLVKVGTGIFGYGVNPRKGIEKIEVDYSGKDLSDWKLGISKTANRMGGLAYPRPDRAFIAEPSTFLADSFLKVGSFSNEKEAQRCLRYLKTNFASYLLAIITPTQNTTRKNYRLIPLINFATGEILDKPGTFLNFDPPEDLSNEELQNFLDKQLAEIYGLTEDECELMHKDLKPWKDKWDVEADK